MIVFEIAKPRIEDLVAGEPRHFLALGFGGEISRHSLVSRSPWEWRSLEHVGCGRASDPHAGSMTVCHTRLRAMRLRAAPLVLAAPREAALAAAGGDMRSSTSVPDAFSRSLTRKTSASVRIAACPTERAMA